MNVYLVIILIILIGEYVLDLIVESLNLKYASPILPEEFQGYYDADKYTQSQNYLKDRTNFSLLKDTIFISVIVAFILIGGFNFLDNFARSFGFGPIATGLVFAGILLLASQIIGIPFSAYRTFVIEEKYDFNRTTAKTFVSDILKSWILGALIGGIVFAGVVWFFDKMGRWAWLYCWIGVVIFQLFLTFIAPVAIMPLFNKFVPLENAELKSTIENYARSQDFKIKGIFKIDASKRSTKSNAFFTGFGKYRRIALFDTLIQKHSIDELVSVLAHEIGHYKKRHIIKMIILSILSAGLMFFILSFFINNKALFAAFKMEEVSVYASLVFFGFLYIPISFILSIFTNFLSRKYEYEADLFAASTYKKPEAMILALKKLVVDNLANLTPHPLKVFLHYNHPPALERIDAIRHKAIAAEK